MSQITKMMCDVCGVEYEQYAEGQGTFVQYGGELNSRWDLCPECAHR